MTRPSIAVLIWSLVASFGLLLGPHSSQAAAAGVPYVVGDVFAGMRGASGTIKHFSPTGGLLDTLNTLSSSNEVTGMCFGESSSLRSTNWTTNNMTLFDNMGNVTTFPWGTGFNQNPESCLLNSSGDIYVGQAGGSADVLKFSPSGAPLGSFNVAVGGRGSDWIDLGADQCTLFYTSEDNTIRRFDVCGNTQLSDFAPNFTDAGSSPSCFGQRIRPNAEVLVACKDKVYRLDSAGAVVQRYPAPPGESFFFALNLDPDNLSFWTAGYITGLVYRFNIATGVLMTSFSAGGGVSGLAIFGEITAAKLTPSVSTVIHDSGENVVTTVPAGTVVHDSATVRPPQPGRPQPAQPVIEPTGTVTFSFYNTIDCTGPATDAGTVPLDSSGTAHPSAPQGPLAPGSYSFQAHYNGDATYNPADSGCEPLEVTQAAPRVTTDIHDTNHNAVMTVPAGSTVHDSATVTGTFGTPTGSVDFTFFANGTCTDPGTPAGSVALNAGTADPSSSEGPLAPGSYSFKAHYSGNATYSPGDSLCEPLTVSPATAAVRTDIHDANHNVVTTVPAGSTVHDSATVTGSFGTPTGTVTFSFFNTIDCTGTATDAGTTPLNAGVADPSSSEGPLAAGSYSFNARYNGSATYGPADAPCEPLRVTAVQTTPKVETEIHDEWHHVVTSVPAGSKVHDKATVTGSAGTPTGTVTFTFFNNNTCTGTGIPSGTIAVDSYGVAHPSTTQGPLAAGSYSFRAHYNGDAKYTAADSPCEPLEVTKPKPTVRTEIHDAWHHAVTSVPEGSKVHDKATVTGSSGTPTGTVSFTFYTNKTCYGTGMAAGTIALDSYGVAHPSATQGPLAAGSYAFKARYNGDGTYSPADSACEPLTVTPKPQQCKPEQKDRGKGKVKDEKGNDGGDFDFDECDDNHHGTHKDSDRNVDFQSNRHDPPKYESASGSSAMSRMDLIGLPIGIKATTIGEGTNNGQPVTYVLVVTDLGLGLGNIYSLTLTDDTGVIYTRTGTLLSGEIVVLQ